MVDGNTSFLVPSGKAEGAPNGPRRVKLVEAWKVEDLVVPVKEEENMSNIFLLTNDIKRVYNLL